MAFGPMRAQKARVRRLGFAAVVLASLGMFAWGCRSATDLEAASACRQTFEFGNHGCARFLVLVDGPAEPLPARHRWSIRAVAADAALSLSSVGDAPTDGRSTIEIVLWVPLPVAMGDTASFWVSATLFDDSPGHPVGVPLPVVAADSALRVTRFTRVGRVPQIDTVSLTLR